MTMMNATQIIDNVSSAIKNYYRYNPDTLMPLLMLALATRKQLCVCTQRQEQVICELDPVEVIDYDWVQLDAKLLRRVEHAIAERDLICVTGRLDECLKGIYDLFHEYDTYTVEQEYHHRQGLLYHHSSNEASEKPHRVYATICLAEAILAVPVDELRAHFMQLAYEILVKSGIQPKRPRMRVARVLCELLDYDGNGRVYSPFAGCALPAALIQAGDKLYADGDVNEKLCAIARLFIYGMGGSDEHFMPHDSIQWRDEVLFDYVMTTYSGYINGKSAFDFCLGKCQESFTTHERYAGIVSPRDFFEKRSEEMQKALHDDWVDTIVLLPFGEVAVLINAGKEEASKGLVKFYNLTNKFISSDEMPSIQQASGYLEFIQTKELEESPLYFKEKLRPKLRTFSGYRLVRLGDCVELIDRETYNLADHPKKDLVLAYIDRSKEYENNDKDPYMQGIEKRPITSLFSPAYHLTHNTLIVNRRGALEPRFFDSQKGAAYFQDGYAFRIKDEYVYEVEWLKKELNRSYVFNQLHPYGTNIMVPERMTEEQLLNVRIFREKDNAEEEKMKEHALECGMVLVHNQNKYRIENFLDYGGFGFTYIATVHNLHTGEKGKVVLKEFFPASLCTRINNRVMSSYPETRSGCLIQLERDKFREESRLMQTFGNVADSHIAPSLDYFYDEETNTDYYVMPYYSKGSLARLVEMELTYNEELIIEKIVVPLCKALHCVHKQRVLHLDIKPDNILLDDNGYALLIDFGVANKYDRNGNIIGVATRRGKDSCTAPELEGGRMVRFGPQPDIYGVAASLYLFITGRPAKPIMDFSDEYKDIEKYLSTVGCSKQFISSIVAGLQNSAASRPKNIKAFLHLFPGCEQIKLA